MGSNPSGGTKDKEEDRQVLFFILCERSERGIRAGFVIEAKPRSCDPSGGTKDKEEGLIGLIFFIPIR